MWPRTLAIAAIVCLEAGQLQAEDAPPPETPSPQVSSPENRLPQSGPPAPEIPSAPPSATDLPSQDVPPPPGTRTLSGRVLEAGIREPLEDVSVRAVATGLETPVDVTTDVRGRFTLAGLPAGRVTLKVGTPGFQVANLELDLSVPPEPVTVFLRRIGNNEQGYAMTVGTRRGHSDARYSLSIEEAARVPGTFNDPIRALENLPGISRAPFGLGLPIIRGADPTDSGFFLNGVSIPLLYHFLGLTSAISGDLIERIDYLPGGYGARYGRLMGGAVALDLKNTFTEQLHGYGQVDLLKSTVYLQGGAGSKLSYAFTARRSYIDVVLSPVMDTLADQVIGYQIRAPRFWDAQLRLNYQLTPRTDLHFYFISSSDDFAVLGRAGQASASSGGSAQFQLQSSFTRGMLEAHTRFSSTLDHQLTLSFGPQRESLQIGNTSVTLDPLLFTLRDEWEVKPNDGLLFRGGLDLEVTRYRLDESLPGNSPPQNYSGSADGVSPAPYLEAVWTPLKAFQVQAGLRVDPLFVPSQGYTTASADPRLTVRWQPRDRTMVIASAGGYSQFPDPTEFFEEIGNNKLLSQHAWQFALGGREQLTPQIGLELTGFYNKLSGLVALEKIPTIKIDQFVLDPLSIDTLAVPTYLNSGVGRAYGLEMLLRHDAGGRFFGWVSYTLSRSERKPSPDDRWTLFDYDQTHVLTLLGSWRLGKGWSAGFRFRYATGNPYTPIANRYANIDTGGFIGYYDPSLGLNYARLPGFHALDLRIDREWVFNRWRLQAALELQNAYNQLNEELWYYNFDYSQELGIYGLPILPVFGVKGEF